MNNITMPPHGILTVRIHIAIAPADEHGRIRGSWRTLMRGYYSSPEDAHKAFTLFKQANPYLHHAELDARYDVSVHFPYYPDRA